MPNEERFSMLIVDMEQPEKDLLECLLRINACEALDPRADALLGRLVRAGLVDSTNGVLALTTAGIRRCQSLQHRENADEAAARVLLERHSESVDSE